VAADKILITGATGKTGGYAIDRLLEMGAPVRALVHQIDDRSKAIEARGVEIVQGDLSDFGVVNAALKGISTAYFVYPIQIPGILEATTYFAQSALEHGVKAIVNMSQISARREATSHAARNHWLAERLLDRWGVPVTHLRPTFFAEWTTYFAQTVREKNLLVLPFGEARFAPIAAEDQGRVIASILTNPAPHVGKTYRLYGPQEITQHDVADVLTRITGRKITYVPVEIPAFLDVLKQLGFNDHFQQHIASVAQDARDGVFSGTSNDVHHVSGQKPTDMETFLTKNKSLFAATPSR
jgi:uncharacterized protein YbjT (DUF2867 family)